jgi:alpha-glucosidase
MFRHLSPATLVLSGLLLSEAAFAASEPVSVSSPDGRIKVSLAVKEKLDPYPAGTRLYYSVSADGKEILLDSPFGIDFKDMPPIARDLAIRDQSRRSASESWKTVCGKSSLVQDRYNELRLTLEETREPGRRIEFIVRAYDDGIGFRYYLPSQPALSSFLLTSERSEFHFAGNHTAWAAGYDTYVSHQESEFDRITLSKITPANIVGLPLTIEIDKSTYVALTEADLTDWAGMYLTAAGNQPNALVTTLSPLPSVPGVLVRSTAPRYSPWRVLLIGRTPGALIESNLILNLNEPCALTDTSWIKPGRSAWDRWWSGDYAPDTNFKVGMNTQTMEYFTRLAADMGWEYVLVDWHWYGDPENPEADITRSAPDVDIPAIVRYARERNVRVLLWLRWNHAERQMEEAFPLYEKWGIAGVKIDFMQRDDQEMVNFYEKTLKLAAKYHLLVDFHGAYKPTGIRRTWPNLITREGVLGNEYNKWSSRVTPEHNVTLPFTRMLAGPMDFTPGGFRQSTKANFRPQDSAPFVMGTRAHQLAMMVVYESPLQVLCDSPYAYRNQKGVDFLKTVPTTWDETRVLNGEIGEYVTIARRSGTRWFIGSMTNSTPRDLDLALDFLEPGQYQAHIFRDMDESAEYPDRLTEETQTVSRGDRLHLKLAPAGGCACWLEQVPRK